ncbi:uncharacterized protein LOC134217647 [Armigeres subalbatus]|uniref:uncharacterized protein LOC134217647 n=1 Tax=Armigeres subalbatus TaxID=124917 RepID=UPI002ED63BED
MWLPLTLSFFIAMATAEQVYQSCADEWLKSDNDWKHHILCKVSIFDVRDRGDAPLPSMNDFVGCTFVKAGWMDNASRALNVAKIAADLKDMGYPDRQDKIGELNGRCQSIYGEKITVMNYLECLAIGPGAVREIIPMLKKREKDFFSKNHCSGVRI